MLYVILFVTLTDNLERTNVPAIVRQFRHRTGRVRNTQELDKLLEISDEI